MAINVSTKFALLLFLMIGSSTAFSSSGKQQSSSKAFQTYWKAYDDFERSTVAEKKEAYLKKWLKIQGDYKTKSAKLTKKQVTLLANAANSYKRQLSEHAESQNRPHVMFNLAKIYYTLSTYSNGLKADMINSASDDAISLLSQIYNEYPRFAKIEETLYLLGNLLKKTGNEADSNLIFDKLASTAKNSIYGVYGLIKVGDRSFAQDNAFEALKHYKAAHELINNLHMDSRSEEKIRILYRLAWASYRAGKLNDSIQASTRLLSPSLYTRNLHSEQKIRRDAIELIGDALFEKDDINYTLSKTTSPELKLHGDAIGYRTLQRYFARNIYRRVTFLGEKLIESFSYAPSLPEIIRITANAYDAQKLDNKQYSALTVFTYLLPQNSLWRARNKRDLKALSKMEVIAFDAVKRLAEWNYNQALASGDKRSFLRAQSAYHLLAEYRPNDSSANDWRLKAAHTNFLTARHQIASKGYKQLINKRKLTKDRLKVASFQLVLSKEKEWRSKWVSLDTEEARKETFPLLAELNSATRDYVEKFPNETRTVDSLTLAAEANRDAKQYQKAEKLLKLALMNKPTPIQRASVIRSLVYLPMFQQEHKKVILASSQFLELENWDYVDKRLKSELEGILSKAALEHGKDLLRNGKGPEAARVMSSMATNFPNLPDREQLFRDSSYIYGINGDWVKARSLAKEYLSAGYKKFEGDELYLLARSEEFLLNFLEAAKIYLRVAREHPSHSRGKISRERAERLGISEDAPFIAADAALLQARRSQERAQMNNAYDRAREAYIAARAYNSAVKAELERQKRKNTTFHLLRSRLNVAKILESEGKEELSIKQLASLQKSLLSSRRSLSIGEYKSLMGETSYLLGLDTLDRFQDFQLASRGKDTQRNIMFKSKLFKKLSDHFLKSIDGGNSYWKAAARFQLGEAANHFAGEINKIVTTKKDILSIESIQSLRARSSQLKDISSRYHNQNIAASSQGGSNEWNAKSARFVQGNVGVAEIVPVEQQLGNAVEMSLPSEWSL